MNLTKRIFLIDCPGVVYHDTEDSDTDAVLKGVVRISALEDAWEHIPDVVARVKPDYLRRAYKVQSWESPEDFLQQVARLTGRLLKGVNLISILRQRWYYMTGSAVAFLISLHPRSFRNTCVGEYKPKINFLRMQRMLSWMLRKLCRRRQRKQP